MKTIAMIATAVALATSPAAAENFSSAPTARVGYSDLDISSASGKTTLQQRIRSAATRVCEVDQSVKNLKEGLATKLCYRSTLADAFRQMDQAIAARRSGTVTAAAIVIVGVR